MNNTALRHNVERDGSPCALTALPVVELLASSLREQMVVVDEFDCPVLVLDHRVPVENRRSGSVDFLCWDVEECKFVHQSFHLNRSVRVAAR